MNPARSHMAYTYPEAPSPRAISAGVRKIPIPTTCPTMRQVAGTRPSDRAGDASTGGVTPSELEAQPELEGPRSAGAENAPCGGDGVAEARGAEEAGIRRVAGAAGEHVREPRVVAERGRQDVRHVEEVEDLHDRFQRPGMAEPEDLGDAQVERAEVVAELRVVPHEGQERTTDPPARVQGAQVRVQVRA